MIASLEKRYGLNEPQYKRYWKWISGIVFRGDFGFSFHYNRPVLDLLKERMVYTNLLSMMSLFFTLIVALPIGIYSAVK